MDASELSCTCRAVHDTHFGGADGRTPTEAMVEAVARLEGCDPAGLDPIYDVVEAESLDRLFERASNRESGMTLAFSYHGWNVFVHCDGRIRLCDPDSDVESAPVFDRPLDD